MNASALLQSQGWLGKGHSLDSHRFSSSSSSSTTTTTTTDTTNNPSGRNARGLVNPLLISRNTDGRGIGTKTHYTSDQWWLSAFDQKLKGLDTTNSKQGITQTVTEGKLDAVGKIQEGKYTGTKGLYAFFVKGGLLEGTVEVDLLNNDGTATPETDDNGGGFSLRAKLAAKRAKKEAKRARENKTDRKERKEAKRLKRERREKKRAEKGERIGETKEERRAKKEERRKKKEAKGRKRAEKENKK
ncbi:hypothetical protein B0T21DRAFT_406435 [Apiosordaria backusii]|uniref:Uncharacterized protein n=1 Tax=Apiosordaria backusii TaxID=314023 RepID=A0AA40EYU6_9PEZI|nr:hypothetical protein B0T21DRAFT_406435 [Apiosordaria backusii]